MELGETNPGPSHSYGWIYQMHIEPALPFVMDCIYFFPTGPLAGSSLWICPRHISRSNPALTLRWWASTALASLDVKWCERVQRVCLCTMNLQNLCQGLEQNTSVQSNGGTKWTELQPRRQKGQRSGPKRSKVTANRGANSSWASVCHSHYIIGGKSGAPSRQLE